MSDGCESPDAHSLPPAKTQGIYPSPGRDKFPHIGAIVSLKSGGPRMMVVDYVKEGLTVSWRDGARVLEISLPQACLRIVSPL